MKIVRVLRNIDTGAVSTGGNDQFAISRHDGETCPSSLLSSSPLLRCGRSLFITTMNAPRQLSRKRGRYASSDHHHVDWQTIYDELSASCAHGAITRTADRHGINRRTLSDRWYTYQRAVQQNDVATQQAMLGLYDRRRDNRIGVPRDIEQQAIDRLLTTNPAPTRADVRDAMLAACASLPLHTRRTTPRPLHYSASNPVVTRIIRQHKLTHKLIRLRRRRVKEKTEEEKEEHEAACLQFVQDVQTACLDHGRSMVINVDETGVRTINTRRRALARKGDWERQRPVVEVTRSTRESTSLVCAVAADGSKLRPCVLTSRRSEASLRKDSWWDVIRCGGWTDAAVYIEYLKRVILPYTAGRPATLVHDSLTAHHTDDVLSFLSDNNISLITVPPGETDTLQPLDVGVFGPLKARAKRRWNEEKAKDKSRADTQHASMSLHVEAFAHINRRTVRAAWEEAVPLLAAQ
jgi:hypothetical protein